MKAIVLHGPGDVRVDSVPDARLSDARGAIGAMRRYIRQYLSPEGIATSEALRAQV